MNQILIARIVKIIQDDIWIAYENKQIKTNIKGIFRNQNIKPMIGDFVTLEWHHQDPIIVAIEDRQNQLYRPNVANVDIVVILQSTIEPTFTTLLIDKMITCYENLKCEVLIAVTKTDLSCSQEVIEFMSDYRKMGYGCYDINNDSDLDIMIKHFSHKVICFVGNSGVGKSTLINRINPELKLRTQEISKALNRGKHTTTNSTLIKHDDYYIVDTPGYSNLQCQLSQDQFAHQFFNKLIPNHKYCKFDDCLHKQASVHCLVLELLNTNKIATWRYNNYLQILETLTQRYDSSYKTTK